MAHLSQSTSEALVGTSGAATPQPKNMKYVLVTGGVVSGLGKGVTASSIGVLLKGCGYRCTSIKIDPYLNLDAGTMSPFEHGEVFVLDDGGEVDLDLGNYERFLDVCLTRDHNITTGKIYQAIIEKERRGSFLGKTVQVIPHVTDAIQDWIEKVALKPVDASGQTPDVCIIELGGTVGDIESSPFIEALRQFQFRAQFCHVPHESVLTMHDVSNLWRVPLLMESQGAHHIICRQLGLAGSERINLNTWRTNLADRWDSLTRPVRIALIGKYNDLADAYLSVVKALQHACMAAGVKLDLRWVDAEMLEDPKDHHDDKEPKEPKLYEQAWEEVHGASGILVPGGFGNRGVKGKILAANYARTHKKPYLGICLGMQIAVIEFARNVLGLEEANSTEFDNATPNPVVVFMPEISATHMGGTMRLGSRRTVFTRADCMAAKLYQRENYVEERHRHRYEVNPEYVDSLEASGLEFVGRDDTGKRMEIVELLGSPSEHPFYIGCQYHPEFKTRPGKPSPLFLGFIQASAQRLDTYLRSTPRTTPVGTPAASPLKPSPLSQQMARENGSDLHC